MPREILLNPDNRSLTPSPGNDLSQYGPPAQALTGKQPDSAEASVGREPPAKPEPATAAEHPATPAPNGTVAPADDTPASPATSLLGVASPALTIAPPAWRDPAAEAPGASFDPAPSPPSDLASAEPAGPPLSLAFDAFDRPLAADLIAADIPQLASLLSDTVALVPAAATLPIQDVLGEVSALVGALQPATPLEAAGGVVGDAVEALPADALQDTLSDLLGADPQGGIATLTSLVTITDVVTLPSGAEAAEVVQSSDAALIDALAGGAEDVGLLPDADGALPDSPVEAGGLLDTDLTNLPLPPPPDPLGDDLHLGLG